MPLSSDPRTKRRAQRVPKLSETVSVFSVTGMVLPGVV